MRVNGEICLKTVWFMVSVLMSVILLTCPAAAAEEMPVPQTAGNCSLCHNAADHQTGSCESCHDNGKYESQATLAGGHGGLNVSDRGKFYSTGPVGNCVVCHTYTNECENCHPSYFTGGPSPLQLDPNPRWTANYSHDFSRVDNYAGEDNTYTCEKCHIQSWWSAIPRHDSSFGSPATHNSSTTGCGTCHSLSLTTEHYRWTNAAGTRLDCFTCHGSTSSAVKQAVKSDSTGCGACHNLIHNLNTVPGLPAAALLYPGLKWTSPLPLSIWQGEPWVEDTPGDYKVIISERSVLSSNDVFQYYSTGMLQMGWSLQSPGPTPGGRSFKAVFIKGTDKITVLFYDSENYSLQNEVPTGSRIQIIYKG